MLKYTKAAWLPTPMSHDLSADTFSFFVQKVCRGTTTEFYAMSDNKMCLGYCYMNKPFPRESDVFSKTYCTNSPAKTPKENCH